MAYFETDASQDIGVTELMNHIFKKTYDYVKATGTAQEKASANQLKLIALEEAKIIATGTPEEKA